MFSFKETDYNLINDFNSKTDKGHIFQTSYWADVKGEWIPKYIAGFDKDGNVLLTCTLLLRKIPYVGKYMAYAPRGFVCDFLNKELLEAFTKYLKEFGKKNRIAFIKIDPDIHIMEDEKPVEAGEIVKKELEKLSYNHRGAKNFENIQPNFVFRLDLDNSVDVEEENKRIFDNFTSKTRYNIRVANERGLTCEIYDKDNITDEILDKFHELMVITGKRDKFITRPRQYFKDMIDKIYPYSKIYMIKYNYQSDFDRLNEKLDAQVKNIERFTKRKDNAEKALLNETDAEKIERGNKRISDLEKSIAEAERQADGFKDRIKEIEEFKEVGEVYISGSVYLYYGGKGWYLYGASHNILRDTMPNFLMQWRMIEDTIASGGYLYDFRGVSGDLSEDNPLFGLYKFKKGFNGKFVEFLGEFDLVIDRFTYTLFNRVLPIFKRIRKALRG